MVCFNSFLDFQILVFIHGLRLHSLRSITSLIIFNSRKPVSNALRTYSKKVSSFALLIISRCFVQVAITVRRSRESPWKLIRQCNYLPGRLVAREQCPRLGGSYRYIPNTEYMTVSLPYLQAVMKPSCIPCLVCTHRSQCL